MDEKRDRNQGSNGCGDLQKLLTPPPCVTELHGSGVSVRARVFPIFKLECGWGLDWGCGSSLLQISSLRGEMVAFFLTQLLLCLPHRFQWLHCLGALWCRKPPLQWEAQLGFHLQNRPFGENRLSRSQHLCQQPLLGRPFVHQPVVCLQMCPSW